MWDYSWEHPNSRSTWLQRGLGLNGALENILEGVEVMLDGGWGNSGCIHICTRRFSVQLDASKCVYVYICAYLYHAAEHVDVIWFSVFKELYKMVKCGLKGQTSNYKKYVLRM